VTDYVVPTYEAEVAAWIQAGDMLQIGVEWDDLSQDNKVKLAIAKSQVFLAEYNTGVQLRCAQMICDALGQVRDDTV
jgi:hypothetical protein